MIREVDLGVRGIVTGIKNFHCLLFETEIWGLWFGRSS